MKQRDIILAAFAPAKGSLHTPVQVQKLLFLIDREIPQYVDGPHFNFKPYHYGPFDLLVYDELATLAEEKYIDIVPESNWNSYRLTDTGQKEGEKILNSLNPKAKLFIETMSVFVRSVSFEQLVSAIYKAYPEMKENSVFRGC